MDKSKLDEIRTAITLCAILVLGGKKIETAEPLLASATELFGEVKRAHAEIATMREALAKVAAERDEYRDGLSAALREVAKSAKPASVLCALCKGRGHFNVRSRGARGGWKRVPCSRCAA